MSSSTGVSIISNKYRISKRLGGGSFGDIYLGEYLPNNEKVAVKFEKHGARCPQLRHEYKVYRELQRCDGFGQVHYFGTHDCYNVMVMELLGPSLEDLFNKCGRRFSLKTVLQIADQVLERVETMHSRHLIHRDIKPANFVIGVGQNTDVYCIDFGLSKRYRHPRTLQHIPYRDGRSLTGTPRYASINNHLGIEQSRRDDLESIGYVLIYFLRGVLPWQGLKAKTASKKYKMIMEKKQSVSVPDLCQSCPQQFADYLTYCRSLSFDSKPDMPYLRRLFRDLYVSQGYANGIPEWDWNKFVSPTPAPQDRTPIENKKVVNGENIETTNNNINGENGQEIINNNRVQTNRGYNNNVEGQVTGEHYATMQQEEEDPEAQPSSPLNKLKQSLRITDDDVVKSSHKRHLSHSQQGDETNGQQVPNGNAWADYKHHIGSRPKTAHGTRMSSTGGSARQSSTANNYCRKCGKVTNGSSSTACGCGSSSVPLASGVVAGARGMMRYRRTRAATIESTDQRPSGSSRQGSTESRNNKIKPTVSNLVSGRGNQVYTSSSTKVKQENFLNGVWRKAKSFARPTSASATNTTRRQSIGNNATNVTTTSSSSRNKSTRNNMMQNSALYQGSTSNKKSTTSSRTNK